MGGHSCHRSVLAIAKTGIYDQSQETKEWGVEMSGYLAATWKKVCDSLQRESPQRKSLANPQQKSADTEIASVFQELISHYQTYAAGYSRALVGEMRDSHAVSEALRLRQELGLKVRQKFGSAQQRDPDYWVYIKGLETKSASDHPAEEISYRQLPE